MTQNPLDTVLPAAIDWDAAAASLEVDRGVPEIEWLSPGASGGRAILQNFIDTKLNV